MAYRYFISTGWSGTGTPASLPPVYDDDENLLAAYYYTLDQALNAAVAGDAVSLAPPNTPGCAFLDAFGKPLNTVVVPLGSNVALTKPITLEGGAYRLRLDGGGNYQFKATRYSSETPCFRFVDVDIVRANAYLWAYNAEYLRCALIGCALLKGAPAAGAYASAYDCLVTSGGLALDAIRFYRCTFYGACASERGSSFFNSIRCGSSSDAIDAAQTFAVSPPTLASDVSDWGAFLDAYDLRLPANSPYATGNGVTSASGVVYDLDGNKRKIGGARGAYEVLGATRTARAQERGWSYAYEKGNASAPDVGAVAIYPGSSASKFVFRAKFPGAANFLVSNDGETFTTLQGVSSGYAQSLSIMRSYRWIKARTARGDATIIRLYSPDDTAPDGAVPCAADFNNPKTWEEEAAPSASDVCCIGSNDDFITTTGQGASKIIVPGWTRPNLGNVPAVDPEIGLNSVLTTRGAITLTNRTSTSAEILAPFDPRSGARVTFKDCAISD